MKQCLVSSAVPAQRTRANFLELKHVRFRLDIKKLTVTEVRNWNNFPRQLVESSLEVFKRCLDLMLDDMV